MEKAIEKADTLIEALGWIRHFRDKTTVIKLGGSILDDDEMLQHILVDVVFMESVGMRPVIVHGGGSRISAAMKRAKIESRFIEGRRYTDEKTLEIVKQVLARETSEFLARSLEKVGGQATTLNFDSTCVLRGTPLKLKDANGQDVDLGHVGVVNDVDRIVIDNLSYSKQVPIIPSMCLTEEGGALNVNADTAAIEVAKQIGAVKLVILSDIPGVLKSPEDPESRISSLNRETAKELMDQKVIVGGMIPKVEACLDALDHGVDKVHIIDGRLRHSLLLEIYTTSGVGTQIIRGETTLKV